MNDADLLRAEVILEEMAEILFTESNASPWGKRLSSLAQKKTLHPDDFRSQIKGLYGGLGSLNDIVLFAPNGKVDREANSIFSALKEELFQLVSSPSTPSGS